MCGVPSNRLFSPTGWRQTLLPAHSRTGVRRSHVQRLHHWKQSWWGQFQSAVQWHSGIAEPGGQPLSCKSKVVTACLREFSETLSLTPGFIFAKKNYLRVFRRKQWVDCRNRWYHSSTKNLPNAFRWREQRYLRNGTSVSHDQRLHYWWSCARRPVYPDRASFPSRVQLHPVWIRSTYERDWRYLDSAYWLISSTRLLLSVSMITLTHITSDCEALLWDHEL